MYTKIKKYQTACFLTFFIFLANMFVQGPDLLNFLQTPAGYQFSQSPWFDPWDTSVYISAIHQGQLGQLNFTNPFETLSTTPAPVYLVYLYAGFLFSHANPTLVFHVLGICGSIVLALSLWQSIKLLLPNESKKTHYLSFIVAYLGGGIGWLVSNWMYLPDVSVPHVTFYTALRQGHDGLSLSVLILSTSLLVTGQLTTKTKPLILLLISVGMLIHPFSIAIIAAIVSVQTLINPNYREYLVAQRSFLISIAITAGLLYVIILQKISHHPTIAGLSTAIFSTPNVLLIIVSFIAPLFIVSLAYSKVPQKSPEFRVLLTWLLVIGILIYIPVNFQRLLIRSLWFPLALLTVLSLKLMVRKWKIPRYLIAVIVVGLCADTLWFSYHAYTSRTPWKYIPKPLIAAFQNPPQNQSNNLLSLYYAGNIAPTFGNFRTYLGHNTLTPDFENNALRSTAFFQGRLTHDQATSVIAENHINWILWGPEEQSLANRFPYFELVDEPQKFNNILLFPVKKTLE